MQLTEQQILEAIVEKAAFGAVCLVYRDQDGVPKPTNEATHLAHALAALSAEQPKLTLALPAYEKRRIVIASDELIDDERIVCVAIKDAEQPAIQPKAPKIKTWQERLDWASKEPVTQLLAEAMKAEIAELRAAIDAAMVRQQSEGK